MIPYEALMSLPPRITSSDFTRKDTMLYALGCGAGLLPSNAGLKYVYEDGLVALPTMAAVLAWPGFWLRDPRYEVDWTHVLHGEQSVEVLEPLPVEGSVTGTLFFEEVYDKGPEKGALLFTRREIVDRSTDRLLAIERRTSFLRGDGGCGGSTARPSSPPSIPADRECDLSLELTTSPDMALIYRLSGDDNPLHVDPAMARAAGFDRPILHGLAAYGLVGMAMIEAVVGGDTERFRQLGLRFTSPIYPGEPIRLDIWRGRSESHFRATAIERGKVVLDNGHLALT